MSTESSPRTLTHSGLPVLRGLDGLRAIAVVAVVVYHFMPSALPGGFLGVDLFFVISGYLITRLLLAEIDLTGGLSIADFYLRRARRLVPGVLALMLVVATSSALVWRDELATVRGGMLSGLLYVANWWLIGAHQSYFVSAGRPPMLQHLWSLAIEEQFYLVWPWVLAVSAGVAFRGRRRAAVLTVSRLMALATGAVVLAVLSSALMAFIAIRSDVPYGADSGRVYFGTDTHAAGLLLGAAAAALALRARFGVPRAMLRGAMLSDAAALLALALLTRAALRTSEFDPALYRGGFLLVSVLCAVLVVAVPRQGSLLGWLLDRAPLRWLGTRSYSIYLWHWPVSVVTRPGIDLASTGLPVFALRAAITLLLAEGSYRLVEQPFRRDGVHGLATAWRWTRLPASARLKLAPAAVAAGLVLAGALVSVLAYAPRRAQAQQAPSGALPAAAATPDATGPSMVGSVPSAVSAPAPLPTRPVTDRPVPHRSATSRPTVAAAPAPVAVSAFGDSVMLGAAGQLRTSLPATTVHAVEGRQARAVFDDVEARRAAGTLAPVVVIHAGDNGIVSPSDLDALLRDLADRRRVVLLTVRVPRAWEAPNNATLSRVAKDYRNVVLVDWRRSSAGHRDWFYDDGLHLRPAGAVAYSAQIAAAVRR